LQAAKKRQQARLASATSKQPLRIPCPSAPKVILIVAFSLAGKEPSHIVKQHKEKNGE